MKCKITGNNINTFMTFGRMPIANGFVNKENFNKEYFFEMEVGFNEDLSLFQLNDHQNQKRGKADCYIRSLDNLFKNSSPSEAE